MHQNLFRTVFVAAALSSLAGTAHGQPAPPAAPDSSRLFLVPTGRTLPAGSGYFQVLGLGLAQLQMAIGDWFSLGGGTLPIIYAGERPVWITPKVALVRSPRVHAAAGAIQYFASGSAGGVTYGAVTFGERSTSATVGFMQGYGDVPSDARIVFLGVERQHSRHTRLLVEASLASGGGMVIAGVRRVHKRFSSDFGMAVPVGTEGPMVAFPVISFGWRF